MKKLIYFTVITLVLTACFDSGDVTPPMFIPKSPPDSLIEKGIDAHPDNAIYLEWEEPASADDEFILGYYIYRGTYFDGEYKFKYIDEVIRNAGVIYESDSYVDYDVSLDSTYYYYLRSRNDFTESKETSDTVFYRLAHKPTLEFPTGDIINNIPRFEFLYPRHNIDRINNFYFRLYYFENTKYELKLFLKKFRFDLSEWKFYIYLNNNDAHTTIIVDSLWRDEENNSYLQEGDYRWRIDAVSGELGGAPETEGSESPWTYFTVK